MLLTGSLSDGWKAQKNRGQKYHPKRSGDPTSMPPLLVPQNCVWRYHLQLEWLCSQGQGSDLIKVTIWVGHRNDAWKTRLLCNPQLGHQQTSWQTYFLIHKHDGMENLTKPGQSFSKNSLWPIFPACWCREPEKEEVIFKLGSVLGCRKIFFGIGLQENIARRILHPAWTWTSGWEFQQIGSNQEVVRGSISKVRLDCKRQSDRGRNGDAPRQSSRQQSTCTNKNTIEMEVAAPT